MNTFTFDASWNQIKGKLRQKYGQLTDDDVDFVEGKGEELFGRLQSKLGLSAQELNETLNGFKPSAAASVRDTVDQVKSKAADVAGDLKARATEMAGDVRARATEMAGDVRARATEMAGDVRARATAMAGDVKVAASAKAEDLKVQAGEAYDQAKDKARSLHSEGEEYVRQKPRESLLTALAAGFVLGLLLRR